MMKIYGLKQGALNEQERLELAKLLIKAGYTVRLGTEILPNSKNSKRYFVEFYEEGKERSYDAQYKET